jgi:integrase
MAEVQAIKKHETIQLIGHLLEMRCSKQMADIWNIGLNLALRISDLLAIQFDDIQGERLIVKEMKTGKQANIKLNHKVLMSGLNTHNISTSFNPAVINSLKILNLGHSLGGRLPKHLLW